jgi:hypothetical protein
MMERLVQLCEENYFKTADNLFANIYFFYINNGTCEDYRKVQVSLKEGILTKEEFTGEWLKHRVFKGHRYQLYQLYSYHVNLLEEKLPEMNIQNAFESHAHVEPMEFPPSLELFQHHNSVFVFLSTEQTRKTKRTLLGPVKKTLKSHG